MVLSRNYSYHLDLIYFYANNISYFLFVKTFIYQDCHSSQTTL